jgi:hypothetical protein
MIEDYTVPFLARIIRKFCGPTTKRSLRDSVGVLLVGILLMNETLLVVTLRVIIESMLLTKRILGSTGDMASYLGLNSSTSGISFCIFVLLRV